MNASELLQALRATCSDVFTVRSEGDSLAIEVPFFTPDGDGFVIQLEQGVQGWRLTDEGATAEYLDTYGIEWEQQQRLWAIEAGARAHGVKIVDRQLVKTLAEPPTWYDIAEVIQSIALFAGVEWVGQRRSVGEQYRTHAAALYRRLVSREELVIDHYRYEPDDAEGAYAADQGILREPDELPAVVSFAVGSTTTVERAAIKAARWRGWEGTPSLVLVRDGIGVSSTQMRYLRDHVTEVIPWVAEGDPSGERHIKRFLSDQGVPVAA